MVEARKPPTLTFGLLLPLLPTLTGRESLVPGLACSQSVCFGQKVLVFRPVLLCLLPFRYSLRESAFVGWVGLRGAVPIILAIYPVLADAPNAHHMFNIIFFIVVVSSFVPGATVRQAARLLRVQAATTA